MRQAVVNLVEAVRGLCLARSSGGHGVRIGLQPQALPPQLLALLDALEQVDRDGGAGEDELAKVKAGLEGVFRWIKLQGLSTDEPLDILSQALGGKARRKPKALTVMPTFAPSYQRKKAWKPKLNLARGIGDGLPSSLDDHRKAAFDMGEVAAKMGAAAPRPVPAQPEERRVVGMGPC